MLKPSILLNKKYENFEVISEGLIYRKGVIYCFDLLDEDLQMLKKKLDLISKNELEAFLTLSRHYFKHITFDYMGYATEVLEKLKEFHSLLLKKYLRTTVFILKLTLFFRQ